MAKKGKKSKMVHISKLHKNHPYVKAVRTRTTAGFVVLAIILLGIIGVVIWGFVTNWGQGKKTDSYCGSCTRYSPKEMEEPPTEKFTSDHCGKHLAGQCNSFDEVPESYCCGRPTLPTYGEEFDAGVF